MNAFVAALAELCATRRFEEKRLIAPSRRVGNQWLDAAARAGRPVLNARVETLFSLAVNLAASLLARDGLSVAPRRAELLLADRTLRTLLPQRLGYLSSPPPVPGWPPPFSRAWPTYGNRGSRGALAPGCFHRRLQGRGSAADC